jgi:hypothetical protein
MILKEGGRYHGYFLYDGTQRGDVNLSDEAAWDKESDS